MVRKCGLAVITLALSALPWNDCFSQETQPNPVGLIHLMRPVMGLESPTVRKELKFTDEQEQKIKPILEKLVEARAKIEISREFVRLPKEERQARKANLGKIMNTANDEITALLTDEQLARFNQIRIWIEKDYALLTAEVVAELKLATVQTDALTAIYEKHQKRLDEVPTFEGTREEQRRKVSERAAKLRRAAGEESLGVLTKEQREQFDKMRGPEFKVDRAELPFFSP